MDSISKFPIFFSQFALLIFQLLNLVHEPINLINLTPQHLILNSAFTELLFKFPNLKALDLKLLIKMTHYIDSHLPTQMPSFRTIVSRLAYLTDAIIDSKRFTS